jgi:putative NADH-flavin reductase
LLAGGTKEITEKGKYMKIALIGVTGNVGTRIAAELLKRGHQITGIARNPSKIASRPGLSVEEGDVKDEAKLAQLLRGRDVVIHSVKFESTDVNNVIGAAKKAGVRRLLVVGGAGSLEVAPGLQLLDSPDFPAIYEAEAQAGREFLTVLRGEKELDWTYVSPSAFFAPGGRTGKFRIGQDQLPVSSSGESKISMEDFAIAFADEIEQPKHSRQRFTIGY